MKANITRRGYITLFIMFLLLSFAVFYNIKFGRNISFNGIKIESTINRKSASKPNIWFEDFFGSSRKSGPKDIRR